MARNYFPQALAQQMLFQSNIKQIESLKQEINMLKDAISSKQKKHRRCDKQLSKNFECEHCKRVYASDVSLKLHLKLKHQEQNMETGIKNIDQDKQCNTSQII